MLNKSQSDEKGLLAWMILVIQPIKMIGIVHFSTVFRRFKFSLHLYSSMTMKEGASIVHYVDFIHSTINTPAHKKKRM